ncbi:DUF4190 domain-containing protein [Crossiella sp. SN42]|uniref:DUF4190 domain-containing protein n=1 Tax=Crossiella sp. SN42 TaxID=2944808 RepID=UPI0027E0EE24|nr:DUF4190 domain-containing protein [Crossiella sp. SN42]
MSAPQDPATPDPAQYYPAAPQSYDSGKFQAQPAYPVQPGYPAEYGYPAQQQGYQGYQGYPGYQQPYPVQRKTNGLSVAALVCGIIPFFVLPLLGIIFGAIALNQIKRTGDEGRGMALAGLIVGCVWVGLFLLVFLIPLLFVGSVPFLVR